MRAAKAIYGGVVGFLAPGAAYLIAQSGDGLSGNDWIIAGLTAVVTAGAVGGTVYRVTNRPVDPPSGPLYPFDQSR